MLRIKTSLIFATIVFVLFSLFISCTEDNSLELRLKSEYVFFEKISHVSGEVISGSYDSSLVIDFPTYAFNEQNGELHCYTHDININEKLKIIFGNGGCLSGAAGGGCANSLSEICNFPNDKDDIIFDRIDEYGSIYFNYNNKAINLIPEDSRLFVDTTISVQNNGSARIITETRFINHGFQQKSKIYLN